jgi:hypothetical protein
MQTGKSSQRPEFFQQINYMEKENNGLLKESLEQKNFKG